MKIDKCEICGRITKKIHIHHKNKNTSDDRLDNVLFVCSKCHGLLHRKKDRLTKIVPIRFPKKYAEMIKKIAQRDNLDISVWIRKKILDLLNGSI
jgi:predicted HNH restriction endonuclease